MSVMSSSGNLAAGVLLAEGQKRMEEEQKRMEEEKEADKMME